MHEGVSVDAAIAKGHRMVNYPTMMVMFGVIGLSLYLGIGEILPVWIMPVGIGLSFVLAWLCWSFMITRWRMWAFEKVRNVHELKKRAIQEKLIWSDDSIFEKTEIRTAAHKKKWQLLQSKFEEEDVFHDDITIPAETIIYYSKGKNYFEMILLLGGLVTGAFLLLKTDMYIFGSILVILGAYFGYKKYKKATNKVPQIIISHKGIKTVSTAFYNWRDIRNESIVSEGYGDRARCYLRYDYPGGSEHLQIDYFDTNQKTLNKLLALYRGRNNFYP